jgi:uncharacterized protein YecE (DUF72 family)
MPKSGTIRTGIGGWVYAPWHHTFYPPEIRAKDALRYAASRLAAIEINATFYRTQTPASFASWAAQVPDGFCFAVKAARAAAQRKDPNEARAPIDRFLGSGLAELGDRLGPVLWQLPAGRTFDPDLFPRFLDLLPDRLDGLPLSHAIEAAHPSFLSAPALALLSERGIARVVLDKPGVDSHAAITAPFSYLRLQGTTATEPAGYPPDILDHWAKSLASLATGVVPPSLLAADAPAARPGPRDVFCFVIAGAKERAPAAAMALADLL